MLTFASAPAGASNSIVDRGSRRLARRWPLMIALLASLAGLSAQAEPVAISPEGVRASAVDIAYDAEGTHRLAPVGAKRGPHSRCGARLGG